MLASPPCEQESQLAEHFPEHLLPLPGGPQAWRAAGDARSARALVLLHGISSGAGSWLGVALAVQRARPGLRVLAWDAPGYGRSAPLAAPAPTPDDYGRVLGQSLARLGVRRCTLVGHSLGALVAAHWAAGASGRALVQNLVLISPAGGYGADLEAAARVRQQRLAALAEKGIANLAAGIDQRLAAPGTPQPVRQWLRWNAARLTPGGYAQAVELLCRSDLRAVAGQLPMPVRVWVGGCDVVTPPQTCAAHAAALGAPLETFPGAGHAVPAEQAEAVALRLLAL